MSYHDLVKRINALKAINVDESGYMVSKDQVLEIIKDILEPPRKFQVGDRYKNPLGRVLVITGVKRDEAGVFIDYEYDSADSYQPGQKCSRHVDLVKGWTKLS